MLKKHQYEKIEAIIRPATLNTVVEALVRIGVRGMTLSHVRGSGRQKGHCELYRGPDYVVDLLPKVKLEVLALDKQVEEIIGTLQAAARTGRIGDGKIFVWPMEKVVRMELQRDFAEKIGGKLLQWDTRL